MPRSRVLSFMSQWGGPPRSPTVDSHKSESPAAPRTLKKALTVDTTASSTTVQALTQSVKDSPSPTTQQRFRSDSRSESRSSRPMSMMQTYQPPMMDVLEDTLPELQPIFTYLNSHSNKLYQEGYFLKLHDLDSRGRPSSDRVWNECFAQLVGTVLSLWDAAALDAAGEDGEVVPTFVNLSDAAIKMIESLPMNGTEGGTLQNVLSISTAANNRYLLHFNSLNSLTQWTAGIRLATYEHATLQEAYTGSLIAGKGKTLNNIRTIMERSKFKTEDWVRVRFGAGTPWRRCWCVVTPPDEKEYHKAQKTLKKRGTYDRTAVVPKGDLKFYESRKVTKKTRPIATITDAYAAYAIYPQSKPLIDQSTLAKIEGLITIHAKPENSTEGFVFIMPEVHPAVTGFEMMLRFLFPVFDTFALYGRPDRLIADTLDQRGLMFAMPSDRRYGYLDILDVSGLIHTEGSQNWNDRQWRKELKKLTSHRMTSTDFRGTPRRNTSLMSRTSLDSRNRGAVRFSDDGGSSSSPTTRRASPASANDSIQFGPPRRTETAPMYTGSPARTHNRSSSEAHGYRRYQSENPSRLSYGENSVVEEYDEPPAPPVHGGTLREKRSLHTLERVVSEPEPYDDVPLAQTFEELKLQSTSPHPAPVSSPPKFEHASASKPARVPVPPPAALQRANSAMDTATLQQLADVNVNAPQYEREQENHPGNKREVSTTANQPPRILADAFVLNEGMVNHYESQSDQKPRHLTTIPGSPPSQENLQSRSSNTSSPPPAPAYKSYDGSVDTSFGQRLESSHSISRKPVLQQIVSQEQPPIPASLKSPSSDGSLRDEIMDHAMLERMLQQSPVSLGSVSKRSPSVYSADESTDYASEKAPSPKITVPKVRTGRLKTVGNPDLVKTQETSDNVDPPVPDVPEKQLNTEFPIDFGPTMIYKPTPRPLTGSTTPGSGPRDGSTPDQEMANRSSSRLSRRSSYFDSRKEENRRSVAWSPAVATPMDVSDGSGLTPEQWVQHRAARASQPLAQSRPTPVYSHGRQMSSTNLLRSTSKTPPLTQRTSGDWTQQGATRLSRTPSGDWTQQGANRLTRTPSGDWTQQVPSRPTSRAAGANRLSRTPSGDWTQQVPSRPTSRAAGANRLSRTPSGDWTQQVPSRPTSRAAGTYLVNSLSTQLSAREQMHVAQSTGSSMLNLSGKDKKRAEASQAPGLIGAMTARQREREAIKDGMRSNMLQHEIVRRQQQVAQMEIEAQMEVQLQAQQQAQNIQLQHQQQQQAYMQQQQRAHAYRVQQEQQVQAMMLQEQLAQANRIQQEQLVQANKIHQEQQQQAYQLQLQQQQEQAYQSQLKQQQAEQLKQQQLNQQQQQQQQQQQANYMYGSRPTSQYMGQSRPTSLYMGAAGYGGMAQQQAYGGVAYNQQVDPRQQQQQQRRG